MSDLKPCPFCGEIPSFPEAKDVFGTCYEVYCDGCGIANISLQIIDSFDYQEAPTRAQVHGSWNNQTHQYGLEYIETVRSEVIEMWNTRFNESPQSSHDKD